MIIEHLKKVIELAKLADSDCESVDIIDKLVNRTDPSESGIIQDLASYRDGNGLVFEDNNDSDVVHRIHEALVQKNPLRAFGLGLHQDTDFGHEIVTKVQLEFESRVTIDISSEEETSLVYSFDELGNRNIDKQVEAIVCSLKKPIEAGDFSKTLEVDYLIEDEPDSQVVTISMKGYSFMITEALRRAVLAETIKEDSQVKTLFLNHR